MSAEFQAVFGWTGESMVPASNWHKKVCDARLVIGERYIVDVYLARSEKSHRHYFACIGECFKNWPEAAERQFDGAEHMRKYALIRTGYRTERQFVASSNAEALRLAAFLRGADDYAEISVKGNIVVEWKATSQNAHAMGAKDFAASKEAVLAFLAGIIGVTVDSLKAQHEPPAKSLLPGTEGNASVESPAAIPHGGGAGATKGTTP